jgi:4-hydroxy-tetrahydrodipicolinate synthase
MVGANTTSDTIELAKHAEKSGADGIGVVTPYYFKLDNMELESFFVKIAKSVSENFPVYLYAIPQFAVNDITPQLAEKIANKSKNIIGIKYSYPDMPRLIRFMDILGGNFSVICGPDELFLSTLCAGGDGTISGTSNVIPEHFVSIYNAYKKGDYETAKKLQVKTNKLISVISGPNNLARYKAALVYRGVIKNDAVRSPLRTLTSEEKRKFIRTIEEMDFTNPEILR